MKPAYYNEIEPYLADWLRDQMIEGLIPVGDVDERSIEDVQPDDLRGYGQCHFFAGCGGWPIAMRLAGVSDDQPIWTGSCPCQPFSVAGRGKGESDKRHLWPEFRRLIAECNPSIVFGEQVSGKAGRKWLSAVRADLETLGYAVGGADLCAASAGAHHIRQRLYWVADSNMSGRQWQGQTQSEKRNNDSFVAGSGQTLPNANSERRQVSEGRQENTEGAWDGAAYNGSGGNGGYDGWLPEPDLVRVVHGLHKNARVVRAYGNAIYVPLAKKFIEVMM